MCLFLLLLRFQKLKCYFVNIRQKSFWFRVPLTIQLKRDNAGHGEVTIKNAANVKGLRVN